MVKGSNLNAGKLGQKYKVNMTDYVPVQITVKNNAIWLQIKKSTFIKCIQNHNECNILISIKYKNSWDYNTIKSQYVYYKPIWKVMN